MNPLENARNANISICHNDVFVIFHLVTFDPFSLLSVCTTELSIYSSSKWRTVHSRPSILTQYRVHSTRAENISTALYIQPYPPGESLESWMLRYPPVSLSLPVQFFLKLFSPLSLPSSLLLSLIVELSLFFFLFGSSLPSTPPWIIFYFSFFLAPGMYLLYRNTTLENIWAFIKYLSWWIVVYLCEFTVAPKEALEQEFIRLKSNWFWISYLIGECIIFMWV